MTGPHPAEICNSATLGDHRGRFADASGITWFELKCFCLPFLLHYFQRLDSVRLLHTEKYTLILFEDGLSWRGLFDSKWESWELSAAHIRFDQREMHEGLGFLPSSFPTAQPGTP